MMQIKDMFVKNIDRDIQGVIMVGQDRDANASQELEEYVVTRELQKHFADFFAAYRKGIGGSTVDMGVWISGFFGSGKSHFLKILSYLLENREVGGRHAVDYFAEDGKITNPAVIKNMKLAAETPTDVILFNIDSKSSSASKQDKEAIVRVFLRVFNEMQGFCGTIPKVADLERQLTERGRYEEFQAAFEEEYGEPWKDSLQDFDFIQDSIVQVLVSMKFMDEEAARNLCEQAMQPYSISIGDFAERVKRYLDGKGKDHHVVFLVDEMGQYIGEDSQLMLNLQTITEDLGRVCGGRAWVIVTSQQDVDSIIRVIGRDFSKIQGRFATRLSLSSANVDEVIKERILKKKESPAQTLRLLYDQKSTIIKNLIVFTGGAEKKLYADGADFAAVYPFVPYQFDLLSSVLTAIRTHGASGKHLSGGERSMLALFKESAMGVMNEDMGLLIPFHRFYDGLENFLDHSHSGVIKRAYDNGVINPEKKDRDVFAINVLKTLFMVKYVDKVNADVESLTSLMVEHIDEDRIALRNRVEEALKILTGQKLIQKNGSIYVFLTDEEQEVNNEIAKINVETAEVVNKAGEMIFDGLLGSPRYTWPEFKGRYAYNYNQVVDDRPYKRTQTYEMTLRVLTPWYTGIVADETLRLQTERNEVIVLLPEDEDFLLEIQEGLKIDRYLRTNTSTHLARYEEIKGKKSAERRERSQNADLYLKEALKKAKIYVNNEAIAINDRDPVECIKNALGRLVQIVYSKLSYIDTAMDENDVRKAIQGPAPRADEPEPNRDALADVKAYIAGNTRRRMKTSMKTLKDQFMKAPYGFVEDDVHWLAARLFRQGDLNFFMSGTPVTLNESKAEDIIGFITKKRFVEKLLMEERVRVSEKDKKAVREVMQEVFGARAPSDDEDMIMQAFKRYGENRIGEIRRLETMRKQNEYPGRKILERGERLFQSVQALSTAAEFFRAVAEKQKDFQDFADDYGVVKDFYEGNQLKVFQQALTHLAIYDDSAEFIVDENLEGIVKTMRSITRMESPYGKIPALNNLNDTFMARYNEILAAETAPVLDAIHEAQARVLEVLSTKPYKEEKWSSYVEKFRDIERKANASDNVSSLRSCTDKAAAQRERLLNEMDALDRKLAEKKAEEEARRQAEEARKSGQPAAAVKVVPPPVKIRRTKHVSIKAVTGTASWRLESRDDVDRYLNELRKKLEAQLEADTIVRIEF